MPEPFDFLHTHPEYSGQPATIRRLNKRHRLIVRPYLDAISGARVLDLGAHDGRWSHAFAAAGAASVVGVEPRPEPLSGFRFFPRDDAGERVELVEGAAIPALEQILEDGDRFDVVAVLGLFYHIIEHFRLLWLIRQIAPGLVIVDGDFALAQAPVIELVRERTDSPLNAVPQLAGQERALKGVPSFAAMDAMADALDFDLSWGDASGLSDDRAGVGDYFRKRGWRRAVCTLRPC